MGGMKLKVGRKMIGTHQGPPRIIPRSSEPPPGLSCPATAIPGEPKPDRFADGCGIFKGIAQWQPTHPRHTARPRDIGLGSQFGSSIWGIGIGSAPRPRESTSGQQFPPERSFHVGDHRIIPDNGSGTKRNRQSRSTFVHFHGQPARPLRPRF